MSRKEDLQQLIINHRRHLQKLKEQQALRGLDTPPAVLLQIEDIEAALGQLQEEVAALEAARVPSTEVKPAQPSKPIVYLYNFGYTAANEPGEDDEVIDWCGEFDRDARPRKIPNPAVWNEKLWPRLAELKNKFRRSPLIRLDGTASLSAGFAFGQTFLQVGRCCLEVSQYSRESGYEWWRSDEKPSADQPEPQFVSRIMLGNPQAAAGVIIINTLPNQNSAKLVADVGEYLGEAEVFKAFGTANESFQVEYNLPAIRQLLIDGFDPGELRELCYDNPVFRPVYDRLADLTGKKDIVQQLLEFVERKILFEELLTWVQQKVPRRYEAQVANLIQSRNSSEKFRGVLVLEVARMIKDKQSLQSWEAATLARASQTILRDFVIQFKPRRVDLFLATPVGLAVFLGHQWNAIGVEVQCHEWAGIAGQYLPSCAIDL